MVKTLNTYDKLSHGFGEAICRVSQVLCLTGLIFLLSLSCPAVSIVLNNEGVNMTPLLFTAGFSFVAFAAVAILTRIPAWYNRAEADAVPEEFDGKNN